MAPLDYLITVDIQSSLHLSQRSVGDSFSLLAIS